MRTFLLRADDVLRGRRWGTGVEHPYQAVWALLGYVLIGGLFYGAIMGTFGLRVPQVLYSAIKVPFLLLATFVISLPSFFVFNTLFGLRPDFPAALRALAATQAGLTLILASLAPFTALWYVSFAGYQSAILFNGVMFGVASLSAQILLRRYYGPLIASNRRHLHLLRAWIGVYAFVGIQMGWILRPFVGAPNVPTQFFREDSWGNAYVVVARLLWDAVRR